MANNIPVHVGIILDGNRRWARSKGLQTFKGHKRGFDRLKEIVSVAEEKGIKHVTFYCLSLENLKRSKEEVNYLLKLIKDGLNELRKSKELKEKDVRFKVFGRKELLPVNLQKSISELEEQTINAKGMTANFCIAYNGQCEIVDAVKGILKSRVNPSRVDQKLVKSFLYSRDSPEIDLIIRTGMEDAQRLSGFMLWDASYAEFKFRTDYWPDYTKEMFEQDLKEYASRQRRFGK